MNKLELSFLCKKTLLWRLKSSKLRFWQNFWLLLSVFIFCNSCSKKTLDYEWFNVDTNNMYNTQTWWGVHFTSADTGYVCGGTQYAQSVVLKTTNGGTTWTEQPTNVGKILFDITFVTPQVGYASAYDQQIVKTTNGGATWQVIPLQAPFLNKSWQPLRSIFFVNDTLGYVAGGQGYQSGILFKTTNGGATWGYRDFDEELRDVFFVNKNVGFICGYGVVYGTTNGGNTWKPLSITGDYFTSLCFVNEQVGYVVGNEGTIAKTTDGGYNWDILRSANVLLQKKWHIEKVVFKNTTHGYIVGDNLVATTTNGGITWHKIEGVNFNDFKNITYLPNTQQLVAVGKQGVIVLLNDF